MAAGNVDIFDDYLASINSPVGGVQLQAIADGDNVFYFDEDGEPIAVERIDKQNPTHKGD